MIDLIQSREAMLAEIGATETAFTNRIEDPHDPAFLHLDQTSVAVCRPWEEILSRLRVPLARRFADVPPERFIRDIERPLKMGLGNAFKRGNQHDRDKRISVEAVVTETGALIAISNDGPGFDVEDTLRRFRASESYFTNKGGGFKAFERAGSVVSYADGGRTLLIRFLRGSESPDPGLALAEDYMASVFSKLGMLRKHGHTLESCQVDVLDRAVPGRPELRYALQIRESGIELPKMILIGRLLSESAARREHWVARQLYKGSFKAGDGLLVPKPLEVFDRHPRLMLYRFDPGHDLREHLEALRDPEPVAEAMRAVALGLRALHRSGISVDFDEIPRRARGRRKRTQEGIVAALSDVLPDRVPRARRFFEALEQRAARVDEPAEPVPIHGSFGGECIRRAEDRRGAERLYVYRFDECRRSHPGFDVGGLIADLSRWESESTARSDLFRAARDVFLKSYFAGDSPEWLEALPFFTSRANLDRLGQALERRREGAVSEIDTLLGQCERSLEEPAGTHLDLRKERTPTHE